MCALDACDAPRYTKRVIRGFRHKGLKRLYERDDPRGIRPDLVPKVRTILAQLDDAQVIEDMRAPGLRLHPLKGDRKGFWSVSVSGNWRVIFRFQDGDALEVELLDYH